MEVKSGYKQTEFGAIPSDWECTTVGEMITAGIIEKPIDGNHGNIHPKSGDFVDWGIPFVMANNVQDGQLDLVNCSFIDKRQAETLQKGFSITGDVLLTHKATIGNTAIVDEISTPYIMLTPQVTYYRVRDKKRLNNHYLRYYFDTTGFQSVLRALAGGGTRAYLGITAQHQLPVVLPCSLLEQQVISATLSNVDELLNGLDRLIAKKRDLKQAAMQQLLTGKTRLPGFSGVWEVKRLGEIAQIKTGNRNNQDKVADGQYPFYVRSDIVERINSYSNDCEAILVPGEGRIGEIFHYINGRFDVHQRVYAITEFSPYVSAKFIFLSMVKSFGSWALQNTVKATVDSLRLPTFQLFQLRLPPTHAEQMAIANILTDMDAELTALERRHEKTRALKQAMMQELLTGKTRLV